MAIHKHQSDCKMNETVTCIERVAQSIGLQQICTVLSLLHFQGHRRSSILLTVSIRDTFEKCISHVTIMCSYVIKAREYADSPQTSFHGISQFCGSGLGILIRLNIPKLAIGVHHFVCDCM